MQAHSEKILDISDIEIARKRISPYIKRTPLERSESLSRHLGTNVFVKYELFQKTGAFKARGTFNKLLTLSNEEKERGVVAVSGGNHAQAVSYAASVLGIDAVILMPENTPKNYVEATRGYGATVDLQPTIAASFAAVEQYKTEGRVPVHPFDDLLVMAGQGTVGLEIMEDLPEATDVVISIGGGGFGSGVSTAVKTAKPSVKVWGVETEGAESMSKAFAAGQPVEIPITSIAKTLGAPSVSERTYSIVKGNFESVTVVSDADAVRSLVFIAERLKVLTEPAAACTLSAAERLKQNFKPDSNVVLVLCGGNLGIKDLCSYL